MEVGLELNEGEGDAIVNIYKRVNRSLTRRIESMMGALMVIMQEMLEMLDGDGESESVSFGERTHRLFPVFMWRLSIIEVVLILRSEVEMERERMGW